MRAYDIVFTDPVSQKIVAEYSSIVNGRSDPGALNIEFDLPVAAFAVPSGDAAAYVKIWGVSLQDVAQSRNLNGLECKVYAGMSKGLPLATEQVKNYGLLIDGFVWQGYGNWLGNNQSIDVEIRAGFAPTTQPRNLSFSWPKGTTLASAIENTLSQAFPTLKRNINISANLILAEDAQGYYETIVQFAQWVKTISRSIIGGTYSGADIQITGTTFNVFDSTTPQTPKQINFNDLIGQATWIGPLEIQFNTAVRADLAINDYVLMPKGQVSTASSSLSNFRQGSVFQGKFQIIQIRHVGSFRQPDGESWISTFNAVSVPNG
jgi:hypothetical protein